MTTSPQENRDQKKRPIHFSSPSAGERFKTPPATPLCRDEKSTSLSRLDLINDAAYFFVEAQKAFNQNEEKQVKNLYQQGLEKLMQIPSPKVAGESYFEVVLRMDVADSKTKPDDIKIDNSTMLLNSFNKFRENFPRIISLNKFFKRAVSLLDKAIKNYQEITYEDSLNEFYAVTSTFQFLNSVNFQDPLFGQQQFLALFYVARCERLLELDYSHSIELAQKILQNIQALSPEFNEESDENVKDFLDEFVSKKNTGVVSPSEKFLKEKRAEHLLKIALAKSPQQNDSERLLKLLDVKDLLDLIDEPINSHISQSCYSQLIYYGNKVITEKMQAYIIDTSATENQLDSIFWLMHVISRCINRLKQSSQQTNDLMLRLAYYQNEKGKLLFHLNCYEHAARLFELAFNTYSHLAAKTEWASAGWCRTAAQQLADENAYIQQVKRNATIKNYKKTTQKFAAIIKAQQYMASYFLKEKSSKSPYEQVTELFPPKKQIRERMTRKQELQAARFHWYLSRETQTQLQNFLVKIDDMDDMSVTDIWESYSEVQLLYQDLTEMDTQITSMLKAEKSENLLSGLKKENKIEDVPTVMLNYLLKIYIRLRSDPKTRQLDSTGIRRLAREPRNPLSAQGHSEITSNITAILTRLLAFDPKNKKYPNVLKFKSAAEFDAVDFPEIMKLPFYVAEDDEVERAERSAPGDGEEVDNEDELNEENPDNDWYLKSEETPLLPVDDPLKELLGRKEEKNGDSRNKTRVSPVKKLIREITPPLSNPAPISELLPQQSSEEVVELYNVAVYPRPGEDFTRSKDEKSCVYHKFKLTRSEIKLSAPEKVDAASSSELVNIFYKDGEVLLPKFLESNRSLAKIIRSGSTENGIKTELDFFSIKVIEMLKQYSLMLFKPTVANKSKKKHIAVNFNHLHFFSGELDKINIKTAREKSFIVDYQNAAILYFGKSRSKTEDRLNFAYKTTVEITKTKKGLEFVYTFEVDIDFSTILPDFLMSQEAVQLCKLTARGGSFTGKPTKERIIAGFYQEMVKVFTENLGNFTKKNSSPTLSKLDRLKHKVVNGSRRGMIVKGQFFQTHSVSPRVLKEEQKISTNPGPMGGSMRLEPRRPISVLTTLFAPFAPQPTFRTAASSQNGHPVYDGEKLAMHSLAVPIQPSPVLREISGTAAAPRLPSILKSSSTKKKTQHLMFDEEPKILVFENSNSDVDRENSHHEDEEIATLTGQL